MGGGAGGKWRVLPTGGALRGMTSRMPGALMRGAKRSSRAEVQSGEAAAKTTRQTGGGREAVGSA